MIISKAELDQLLEEIITPRIESMGLTVHNGYSWYSKPSDSIRHGLNYQLLKGAAGTFSWGACLDFIPFPSGSSIRYFRTEKAFQLQLFEWTKEYAGSFSGGSMKGGITTHLGLSNARKSITDLFNTYEERISSWLNTARSIENLIAIAKQQIDSDQSYNLHSPSPRYILAFLLAQNGQRDEALACFDLLNDSTFNGNLELREKIRAIISFLHTPTT